MIHPTAVIDPTAHIGKDVQIGAYCVIGAEVSIGDGSQLRAHVVIEPYVTVGAGCEIFSGAVLGGIPQDRKFKGEKSFLIIGDNNVIREHVTIHRAAGAGNETRIGDGNQIMAYCHIGHNCIIGSGITMANMVGIAGHVEVEDRVVLGGIVGIHQFVRIGKLAMIGGYSKVVQDIPPFMMADGRPCKILDLNVIGLRRSGVSAHTRADLKQAYKTLYRSSMNMSQALETIETDIDESPERDYLLSFIRNIRFGSNGRQNDAARS
ncbi:MAG: acyl-ACP--UDP-N-acetylglucosamine O-acyltransferase [Capsulimonas sp.]|jgi:UDP-N-acetylglucosamine acyltransferase|uniref:acyl-ACP--UDP-N-acetylglucosamine O-acyltransferase n=1 Tax=Capsulimonas sp. TaxID=2494211 RepID=UPI003264F314|nr:Acyl-[acyl-carrier-protein]--UDP-N-acetylglucosamine O-acyltransferase [Capsulimonas sp.]